MKEVRPLAFRKWEDISWKEWIFLAVLFLPAIMIPFSSYVLRNVVMSFVFLVILVVVGTSSTVYFEYHKKTNFTAYAKQYKMRLIKLREILQSDDISSYDRVIIEGLISQCNEKLPSMLKSNIVFRPLGAVFTTLVIPLVSIGVAVYLDNIEAEEILYFIGAIITLVLVGVMIYYSIVSPIFGLMNRKHTNMNELKFMLMDLLIYDFS